MKKKLEVRTLQEDIEKVIETYGEDPWANERDVFDVSDKELDKLSDKVKTGKIDPTLTGMPEPDLKDLKPKKKGPHTHSKSTFHAITKSGPGPKGGKYR